ncbi:MAG: hypothetical protein HY909_23550 [Deltaproteobacteria bacterium]|nr:hypothetical protein [Deltaproteobacteria bacterium]
MANELVPCTSCSRHLRAEVAACPFCGAEHVPEVLPAPRTAARLSRAAMVAFGSTVLLAGCGGGVAPAYGAPAPPADAATGDATDGAADTAPADTVPADTPGVRYGAPPPPDAR